MKRPVAGLVLVLWVHTAGAIEGFTSGNDLLEECRAEDMHCLGYIRGASDMLDNLTRWNFLLSTSGIRDELVARNLDRKSAKFTIDQLFEFVGSARKPLVCKPGGVTLGQLKAVVVKSLEDNPARLHLDASLLTLNAFMEAFPCE